MQKVKKTLGIIAGRGILPTEIIEAAQRNEQPYYIIAFENITEIAELNQHPHLLTSLGEVGNIFKALNDHDVETLVLAGGVGRPDFASLSFDFTGVRLLKNLMLLPSQGDDQVFSAIIQFIEKYDFNVIGVDVLLDELLIQEGTLGAIEPDKQAIKDIAIAKKAALTIGELDIGQAAIAQLGTVLSVEGLEGTDRLIERTAELHTTGPGGVLVKMRKPHQDNRVDLPSMGIDTVENAHKSGLRGIALEAEGALIINREQVIERANALGIFIVGIRP